MDITRISTRDFGGLGSRTVELGSSFQVIVGRNEAGKSSVARAIFSALFDDAKGARFKQQCYWGADSCAVTLEGEANGVPFVITRDTANKTNRLEVAGKSFTAKGAVEKEIAQLVGLPSQQSYLNSAWVDQDELRHIKDERRELSRIMEERLVGAGSADLKAILKNLGERMAKLVGTLKGNPDDPKGGDLKQLLDERYRLQQELSVAEAESGKLSERSANLPEDRRRRNEAKAASGELEELLRRAKAYDDASKKLADASQALERVKGYIEKRTVIETELSTAGDRASELTPKVNDLSERLEEYKRFALERERQAAELVAQETALANAESELTECEKLGKRQEELSCEVEGLKPRVEAERSLAQTAHEADNRRLQLASQRRELATELAQLTRTIKTVEESESRETLLRQDLEALPTVLQADRNNIHKLPTEIESFTQAIEGLGVQLRIEPDPTASLSLAASCDGAAVPEALEYSAKQAITVHIAGVATIEARNTSEGAELVTEIERKQAVYQSLLSRYGVACPEELDRLYAKRQDLTGKISEEHAAREALLGGKTVGELRSRAAELSAQVEALQRSLDEAPPPSASPEEQKLALQQLEQELRKKQLELATLDGRLQRKPEIEASIQRLRCGTAELHKKIQELADGLLPEQQLATLRADHGRASKELEATKGRILSAQGGLNQIPALEQLEADKKSTVSEITIQHALTEQYKAFQLSPEETVKRENELTRLYREQTELRDAVRDAERDIASARYDPGDVESLCEQLSVLEDRLARLTLRAKAIAMCRDMIEEAREKTVQGVLPDLRSHTGEYLRIITGGRYEEVELDSDFKLSIKSPEKAARVGGDGWIKIEKPDATRDAEASGGVIDQAYLATRLALVKALCKDARPPVILDDPLLNFDEERVSSAFDLLREFSKEFQVILLTCHNYPGLAETEQVILNREP